MQLYPLKLVTVVGEAVIMEDIANELELDDDAEPIPLGPENE